MMFRKLLSFDEAKRTIQKAAKIEPLGIETVPLLEVCGRVLAENVVARLDIPPFDRSTVDGYAVKAEDTFGAEENKPVKLKLCGNVSVGERPRVLVKQGVATEIVTGAPMPKGADAVVMVEDTEQKGEVVYVYGAVTKDENVMKAGADIRKGEAILKAGQTLGSREIGALAAVGLAKVKVYAIPRVAVLSTGAEVTEPGKKLPSGKIYDINAYSLSTAVLESGGKPVFLGVFPDNLAEIKKALRLALDSADMIVTSGGVSVGPKDVTPKALESLREPIIIVCGIAVKPGKPTTVALASGKLIFALPGHPASALLMFHLFARPLILGLAGRKAEKALKVKALAGMRMFPAKGRRTFVMVALRRNKSGRLVANPVPTGASGAIMTLLKADGYVEITENRQFVDAGEEVTIRLFQKADAVEMKASDHD
jgi:putative molybdopterin biosynthesis protein